MQTIISDLFYAWGDVDECFARAVNEFGLDGVELSYHFEFARPHAIRQELPSILPARDKHGAVLSAHLWEDLPQLGPEAGAEALLRWLDICRDSGVAMLVIHGGTYADRREGLKRIREAIEPVVAALERDGVVLHLENHYPFEYRGGNELLSEPWEFLEILPKIDSPSLRMCFDTGHARMSGNTDGLLGELGEWIDYVHVVDNVGPDDDHTGYKQGKVDWDAVWQGLESIGFDGTYCVEFEVREDHAPFRQFMGELAARTATA